MSLGTPSVEQHYGRSGLITRILNALLEAGLDIENLQPADLLRIDQLHMGGHKATLALAERIGLTAGMRLLDVGSGLGGTPRLLAGEYGCHVTGVDLTHAYCEAANELTRRVGLADQVTTLHADALAIPLPADCFDLIWCQHTQMNIPDKPGLVREFARLLRPGGRLALHEVFAGNGQTLVYPVPWASGEANSHLVGCDTLLELLGDQEFELIHREDVTASALAWWQQLAVQIKQLSGGSKLGPRLIFGERSRQFGPNVVENLREGRIRVYELILAYRPASESN